MVAKIDRQSHEKRIAMSNNRHKGVILKKKIKDAITLEEKILY